MNWVGNEKAHIYLRLGDSCPCPFSSGATSNCRGDGLLARAMTQSAQGNPEKRVTLQPEGLTLWFLLPRALLAQDFCNSLPFRITAPF